MTRTTRALWAAAILSALPAVRQASAATSTCEPDGVQTSGAIYRICMPAVWNGDLVVYAHGYVGFNEPVAIPEDQLVLPDGTSVPQLVNTLGFAFATTSYSTNGLAVVQGIDDVVDLVHVFTTTPGAARHVFLAGPSEGGLITTLAVERHPDVFSGGLAACGPIGDFRRQINYDGDFRVVFDYFFPGVIPGSPISVPADVIDGFTNVYVPAIQAATQANPDAVRQLLKVTHAPTDQADPSSIEATILGLAFYDVFATNDAGQKLGGQPYSNWLTFYRGSDDDVKLNANLARFTPDSAALTTIRQNYQTTGRLRSPLVTLHTTGDPIVPYWHEPQYTLKTLLAGSFTRHINMSISRYGHCQFKATEALAAFAVLVFMVNRQNLNGVEAVLPDAASQTDYRALIRQYGGTP